jgi:tight adherence protein B
MSDSLTLTKFAGLLRSGVELDRAIQHIGGIPENTSGLRYLLEVAKDAGASVANEIDVVADLFTFKERSLQRITVAHASPKASARLVLWLPLLTLAIAELAGINVLESLATKPLMLISLGLGLMLLLLARALSNRLIKRAKPKDTNIGFYLMGVALESSGGASLNQAQNRALDIYAKVFGKDPTPAELTAMAQVALLVEQTGARVGDLLRRQAEQLQRESLTATEIQIEKLSVRLMLPLGLAVLPAFLFLTVIPLMFSMLGPK